MNTMKRFYFFLSFIGMCLSLPATNYFVATNGSDTNSGTIEKPFATLRKAQSKVVAGDTVYIRRGTYKITESEVMEHHTAGSTTWSRVFKMDKSGTGKDKRICYSGYKNERPVFDLSEVKPVNERVIVFYVSGSYLHFRNMEVVGTQVTITEHTQSECFRNEGGSNNIYEHLSMHDGMAIGFYIVTGKDNLVLNCDAYNNYDPVSDSGSGGNVDGFGGHLTSESYTGNVFRGCRAWYNSDDGFDLINCKAAFTIDNCWSFLNGYTKEGDKAGDGTGFKSGGYGMSDNPKVPKEIPMHTVQYCLAYKNKNKGFYANHHLGGIAWYNNTGYQNPSNFCMLNRKSASEKVDVPGYGHIIKNNISYMPQSADKHLIDVDETLCEIVNNSFAPESYELTSADFISLEDTELMNPRQADGTLPDIGFLKIAASSVLYGKGMGYEAGGQVPVPDEDRFGWLEAAAIAVEDNMASVVGPDAELFTSFFVNNNRVSFTERKVDLSSYQGLVMLEARAANGTIVRLKVNK